METGCDVCGDVNHEADKCPDIQPDDELSESLIAPPSLARQTLPPNFDIKWLNKHEREEVISKTAIASKTKLGFLTAKQGEASNAAPFQLGLSSGNGSVVWFDSTNENECNWLSLVKPACDLEEQNCMVFQLQDQLQFSTIKDVKPGEALCVWYARGYARRLGKPETPPVTSVSAQSEPVLAHQHVTTQGQVNIGVDNDVITDPELHISDQEHVENLEMLECQFLYTCSICGDVAFNSLPELEQHMAVHDNHSAGNTTVAADALPPTELENKEPESRVEVTEKDVSNLDDEPAKLLRWKCSKCDFRSDTTADLALHITTDHLPASATTGNPRKRVWTCAKCGVVFSNPRALGIHRKLHHPVTDEESTTTAAADQHRASNKQVICIPELTADAGVSLSAADNDLITPDNELISTDTPLTLTDEQLASVGATLAADGVAEINVVIEREPEPRYGRGQRRRKKKMRDDLYMMWDEEEEIKCPHCHLMFIKEALREHIDCCHSYACTKCNVKFVHEESLKKHLCKEDKYRIDIEPYKSETKSGVYVYTCFFCQMIHSDPKAFHEHLAWHCLNVPCDICKTFCGTVDVLESHVLTCSGSGELSTDELGLPQPQFCSQCGASLCDSEALQAHMSIHSDYKCLKCGETYNTRYGLQKHLLICDQTQLENVSPVFACLECNSVFSTQIGLEYHNKDHIESEFTCKDCNQSYKLVDDFEKHECECSVGDFVCEICDRRFRTDKKLSNHYLKHSQTFDCTLCQHSFDATEDLIQHSLECSAKDMLEKTGKIDCAHCELSFESYQTYKEHLAIHTHLFECKHCNKRFRKKYLLNQHGPHCPQKPQKRNAVYPQPKSKPKSERNVLVDSNYKCPVCQKMFIRKDFYLQHECRGLDGQIIRRSDNMALLQNMENEEGVICFKCGKTFSSQSALTKHLKLHEGKKNISCEVCGKTFYDIHAMKVHHDSTHTSKLRVQCEQCKKYYRNKYSLHTHMRHFHAAQPTFYACEICGKIFRQKGNMTKHMVAHDVSKHYRCNYCNKTFKYPEQLKKHSLLHTHGKMFGCELCDRRFLLQYELTKHVQEMHSNKIYVCGFCNETCRWKHTIRRHIKRKHPRHANVADDKNYLDSLLKDANELDESQINRMNSELHNPTHDQPLIISMDSLTADQIVELDEQIVGQVNDGSDEGSTIQLYNQSDEAYLPQAAAEALQKLSSSISQPQQQLIISGQQFTINFTNSGQTILTPIDMHSAVVDSNTVGTSLLRTHHNDLQTVHLDGGGNSHREQMHAGNADSQVVISQEQQQVEAELAEAAEVLLSNDGTMAYTTVNQNSADNTVSFTDIPALNDSTQDDGNKMIFFNILAGNTDNQNQ